MIDCTERMTKELKELLQQYENLFGYDPRGDLSYDLGYDLENEEHIYYKDFIDVLKNASEIKKKFFIIGK